MDQNYRKAPKIDGLQDTEVGLFIDWENLRGGLELAPDIIMLKKIAYRFGRLTVARAYANWTYQQYVTDCDALYKQGIEPVFVTTYAPSGPRRTPNVAQQKNKDLIKNSVDVKMAVDSIDAMLVNPRLRTLVLVGSDASMLHIVGKIRAFGRQSVVIASSEYTPAVQYLADHFYLYETLPSILAGQVHGVDSEDLQEAFDALVRTVEEIRSNPEVDNSFAQLKILLRREIRDFAEERLGFARFEYFVLAAERENHVKARVTPAQQEVYVRHETRDRAGDPLLDGETWRAVVEAWRPFSEEQVITWRANFVAALDTLTLSCTSSEVFDLARRSYLLLPRTERRFFPDQGVQERTGYRVNPYHSRILVYTHPLSRPRGTHTPPPTVISAGHGANRDDSGSQGTPPPTDSVEEAGQLLQQADMTTVEDELIAASVEEARGLLQRALDLLAQRGGTEWNASGVKEAMWQLDPAFDEKSCGYAQFKDFLEAQTEIVTLSTTGHGLMVVPLRPVAEGKPDPQG